MITAPEKEELALLRARVRVLETDLLRTKSQLRKAYIARADLHARLRSLTANTFRELPKENASGPLPKEKSSKIH